MCRGGSALEMPKATVVDDALVSKSLRFRDRLLGPTRRIFGLHWRTLIARPNLLVFGFLATAITVLVGLSWFQRNQADEARSAQMVLNQIAVLTREINNLTLTALKTQNLNSEAEIEMRAARHVLPKAVLAVYLQKYHTSAVEKVWPVLDNYIM